jgi:hypothetical protein
LAFTWKENTAKKVIDGLPNSEWRRKIYPFNYITAKYWNNISAVDANGDGFTTGMSNNGTTVAGDPFFMRTIKSYFSYGVNPSTNDRIPVGLAGVQGLDSKTGWSVLNQDDGVTFTKPNEIAAFQTLLQSKAFYPQLVLEAEPYLLMHNVNSRMSSLGKKKADGSYGCTDCHGGASGVFNGSYDLIGNGKDSNGATISQAIGWNNTNDVVTKALYWDRTGAKKSLSFAQSNTPPAAPYSTRTIQRWELLGFDAARANTLNAITPQLFGLGITPVASITPIPDADSSRTGIQVIIGEAVALSAKDAQTYQGQSVGTVSYNWSFSDNSPPLAGQNVAITFTTAGSKTITLNVTDEESLYASATYTVEAVVPNPITISYDIATHKATFAGLQMPNYRVRILWGDGGILSAQTYNATTAPNGLPGFSILHNYATSYTTANIEISVYNSAGTQIGYKKETVRVK